MIPIELLSSDYHISGDIQANISTPNGTIAFRESYNGVSSTPISQTVAFPYLSQSFVPPRPLSTSTTDFLALTSFTTSHAAGIPFQYGNTPASLNTASATANAEATWTFKPLNANVNLAIAGVPFVGGRSFWGGNVSLMDLTAGTQLYNAGVGMGSSGGRVLTNDPFRIDPALTFDVNHTYSLSLLTNATSADDTNGLSFTANFTSAPEPSSSLLLACGFAGLEWWRRKQQAK